MAHGARAQTEWNRPEPVWWSVVSSRMGKMRSRSPDQATLATRAKITSAGFKKFLELRSVALSPGAWICAREQSGELWIHNSSNRLNPDLANRCSVLSFARRTLTPSAVMR
jgi:hypothetical protein